MGKPPSSKSFQNPPHYISILYINPCIRGLSLPITIRSINSTILMSGTWLCAFPDKNKFKRFIHSANIVDCLVSLTSGTSQSKKPKLGKILGGLNINKVTKWKGTSIHIKDLFYWVGSEREHRGGAGGPSIFPTDPWNINNPLLLC